MGQGRAAVILQRTEIGVGVAHIARAIQKTTRFAAGIAAHRVAAKIVA
jgi:hypothetical protein